ncbi:IclR family transcriptional regulator [Kribbella sancticallisti]|uniref:IclR family transcriptional regulator n=1 Tax=Kribbella sancticallisti TaxID=460087 RepID=A0ABN2EWV0_9ACTN
MAHEANNGSKSGGADGGIQSVARALSILELFDERRSSLNTNQVAELTGLNRGTAYRFCQTLRRLGYLEEIRQSTFRPGLKVLSLAQAVLGGIGLVDMAMPTLQALRHDTGETVNFAMPDGAEVVYVVRLLNDDLLALRLVVGSRLPMVNSSLGRAMLAFMPEERVVEIMERSDFQKMTPNTITDRKKLADELQKTRDRGYAFNDQEIVVGVRGVAAPVIGADSMPIAAVNLSIARPIQPGEVESNLAPRLLAAAADIGERAKQIDRFGR